ncbi:MAG TPA: carboxymuconolactone decarboxylase family protein [Xanthobacteraceae bacterium]|nr:carboxymuconolactone decarboxylase family protein [Xanthobacteraceae bacterium]
MTRVALIEEEDHPELAELIGRIRAGRRGGLLNIYKMLLNSPPLAATWLEHVNAVRWKTQLDGRLRELVIIRIAILNRTDYVLNQHVPHLALADGVSEEECAALNDWQASPLFDARERAVLAYTDAMTRDVTVPEAIVAALRPYFDDRRLVELTVLIGTYNMHNRVMRALDVDLEQPSR